MNRWERTIAGSGTGIVCRGRDLLLEDSTYRRGPIDTRVCTRPSSWASYVPSQGRCWGQPAQRRRPDSGAPARAESRPLSSWSIGNFERAWFPSTELRPLDHLRY